MFLQNLSTLDVGKSCLETVIFNPKEMLGVLNLRPTGNYKIECGFLQQNCRKHFELNKHICFIIN